MARRVKLPSADDLFRPTTPDADAPATPDDRAAPPARSVGEASSDAPRPESTPGSAQGSGQGGARRPSGRVKHDEKMTVYITSAELLELEQARLRLRAEHGLAVDRGRFVREAVALTLADLEALGAESALVRRLTQE